MYLGRYFIHSSDHLISNDGHLLYVRQCAKVQAIVIEVQKLIVTGHMNQWLQHCMVVLYRG